jgi:hypothetical protein
MGEAALAALPRRESDRPPLLTRYSCRELTPRRLSRRSTRAIPSTRSARGILPFGRKAVPPVRTTAPRPAAAALADHPGSRCQWRTAFVKPRAMHPRGTQSIDLRARWLEIGTASAFTAQRYADTKSSINQETWFHDPPTTSRAGSGRKRTAASVGGRRGRSRSSGGRWGDIAAVTAVDGSPTAMRLLVPERARW